MVGKHVDPTAGSVPTDFDFDSCIPPGPTQLADHIAREPSVRRVALPGSISEIRRINRNRQVPAHGLDEAHRGRNRHARATTALDR